MTEKDKQFPFRKLVFLKERRSYEVREVKEDGRKKFST
jgi:hypothetical protein